MPLSARPCFLLLGHCTPSLPSLSVSGHFSFMSLPLLSPPFLLLLLSHVSLSLWPDPSYFWLLTFISGPPFGNGGPVDCPAQPATSLGGFSGSGWDRWDAPRGGPNGTSIVGRSGSISASLHPPSLWRCPKISRSAFAPSVTASQGHRSDFPQDFWTPLAHNNLRRIVLVKEVGKG